MNEPIPSCKLALSPVGPWTVLWEVKVEMPDKLRPDRFARFDYGLDFAGCSVSGIFLSVKKSAGPAKIGHFPMVEKLPEGWVAFRAGVGGLLLRNNQPRLAFIGTD